MDHIILHIPRIETIQLKDILLKEEEKKDENGYYFQIWTSSFFERINKLEKLLLNENQNFEIISDKKDFILKFIKEFKEEHYRNVMEKNIYSCYLLVFKNKKSENFGLCGWIPQFCSFYKVNLEKENYEGKLFYCHLTEEEKKFKFQQKIKKFDYLSIFFKEEYYYNEKFNIPTNHIIWYKRNILNEIRKKCCMGNIVCPNNKLCNEYIEYIETIFAAITFAAMEKKVFYKYYYFKDIQKKKMVKFSAGIAFQLNQKTLSYSKRLAFLN